MLAAPAAAASASSAAAAAARRCVRVGTSPALALQLAALVRGGAAEGATVREGDFVVAVARGTLRGRRPEPADAASSRQMSDGGGALSPVSGNAADMSIESVGSASPPPLPRRAVEFVSASGGGGGGERAPSFVAAAVQALARGGLPPPARRIAGDHWQWLAPAPAPAAAAAAAAAASERARAAVLAWAGCAAAACAAPRLGIFSVDVHALHVALAAAAPPPRDAGGAARQLLELASDACGGGAVAAWRLWLPAMAPPLACGHGERAVTSLRLPLLRPPPLAALRPLAVFRRAGDGGGAPPRARALRLRAGALAAGGDGLYAAAAAAAAAAGEAAVFCRGERLVALLHVDAGAGGWRAAAVARGAAPLDAAAAAAAMAHGVHVFALPDAAAAAAAVVCTVERERVAGSAAAAAPVVDAVVAVAGGGAALDAVATLSAVRARDKRGAVVVQPPPAAAAAAQPPQPPAAVGGAAPPLPAGAAVCVVRLLAGAPPLLCEDAAAGAPHPPLPHADVGALPPAGLAISARAAREAAAVTAQCAECSGAAGAAARGPPPQRLLLCVARGARDGGDGTELRAPADVSGEDLLGVAGVGRYDLVAQVYHAPGCSNSAAAVLGADDGGLHWQFFFGGGGSAAPGVPAADARGACDATTVAALIYSLRGSVEPEGDDGALIVEVAGDGLWLTSAMPDADYDAAARSADALHAGEKRSIGAVAGSIPEQPPRALRGGGGGAAAASAHGSPSPAVAFALGPPSELPPASPDVCLSCDEPAIFECAALDSIGGLCGAACCSSCSVRCSGCNCLFCPDCVGACPATNAFGPCGRFSCAACTVLCIACGRASCSRCLTAGRCRRCAAGAEDDDDGASSADGADDDTGSGGGGGGGGGNADDEASSAAMAAAVAASLATEASEAVARAARAAAARAAAAAAAAAAAPPRCAYHAAAAAPDLAAAACLRCAAMAGACIVDVLQLAPAAPRTVRVDLGWGVAAADAADVLAALCAQHAEDVAAAGAGALQLWTAPAAAAAPQWMPASFSQQPGLAAVRRAATFAAAGSLVPSAPPAAAAAGPPPPPPPPPPVAAGDPAAAAAVALVLSSEPAHGGPRGLPAAAGAGVAGFSKPTNACWMLALLQCVFNTPALRAAVALAPPAASPTASLAASLRALSLAVAAVGAPAAPAPARALDTRALRAAVRAAIPELASNEQHDAGEAWRRLSDAVPALKAAAAVTLERVRRCPTCRNMLPGGHMSTAAVCQLDTPRRRARGVTVRAVLARLQEAPAGAPLIRCVTCARDVDAWQGETATAAAGGALVLDVARFRADNLGGQQFKLLTNLLAPLALSAAGANWALAGVVVHQGTLAAGHYKALLVVNGDVIVANDQAVYVGTDGVDFSTAEDAGGQPHVQAARGWAISMAFYARCDGAGAQAGAAAAAGAAGAAAPCAAAAPSVAAAAAALGAAAARGAGAASAAAHSAADEAAQMGAAGDDDGSGGAAAAIVTSPTPALAHSAAAAAVPAGAPPVPRAAAVAPALPPAPPPAPAQALVPPPPAAAAAAPPPPAPAPLPTVKAATALLNAASSRVRRAFVHAAQATGPSAAAAGAAVVAGLRRGPAAAADWGAPAARSAALFAALGVAVADEVAAALAARGGAGGGGGLTDDAAAAVCAGLAVLRRDEPLSDYAAIFDRAAAGAGVAPGAALQLLRDARVAALNARTAPVADLHAAAGSFARADALVRCLRGAADAHGGGDGNADAVAAAYPPGVLVGSASLTRGSSGRAPSWFPALAALHWPADRAFTAAAVALASLGRFDSAAAAAPPQLTPELRALEAALRAAVAELVLALAAALEHVV